MRTLLTVVAAAAFIALSGPAIAMGRGDPGVNGSLSVTPPGARDAYGRPFAGPGHWRGHRYWRSAHRSDGLPRYAQTGPDYYWPGPQDGLNFGPGPL